jgi:hypothetical protein
MRPVLLTWLSSINLTNLIIWLKKHWKQIKRTNFLAIIKYKKWAANIIFGRRRNKSQLKTHCRSTVDTGPPIERAHWDSSNFIMKGCTHQEKANAPSKQCLVKQAKKISWSEHLMIIFNQLI